MKKEMIDMYGKAVEFHASGKWLNVDKPMTLESLKGQVVLLDFWTYCCINCIHVLEELKWLEKKFAESPFIVIGVHTPKFENERLEENIEAAIKRYEMSHPVFVDNDYYLWDRYLIRAWPSFVLLSPDGRILSKTSGEGRREYLSLEVSKALEEGRKRGTLSPEKLKVETSLKRDPKVLFFPGKIAFDESDRLFISDSNNNRILVTHLENPFRARIVDTIGSDSAGMLDGEFDRASLKKPQGMAFVDNDLYIADTGNHSIRKANLSNRKLSTVSGDGLQGYNWKYSGPANKARLNSPWDLFYNDKNIYVAMAGTHQLWKLNLENATIEAFAGSGVEDLIDGPVGDSGFAQPSGLFVENGRVYVADSEVSAIRFIDLQRNTVHTVAGNGLFSFGHVDGLLNYALLQHPIGIGGDGEYLYIADTYNHAIRKIDLRARRIETLISTSNDGVCSIGETNCDFLGLFEPNDVKLRKGLLYIADTNNHIIRVFDQSKKLLHDLEVVYNENILSN